MTALSLRVLRVLADAEFHSGQGIARALGISRGSVWNAVRALTAAGIDVYRVHARGYRLAQPLSFLDAQKIAAHTGDVKARLAIDVIDIVDSTNTLLMRRALAGAPSGTVIAAEWQESGRGRMGRAWHAEVGGGLTFSLLWRFQQGAAALAGLSLAAGVALVRALGALGAREVLLKWPNDVLWRNAKLAGLLLEMQGDALGPSAVVIGVGLNVRLSPAARARIDQPVADLNSALGGAEQSVGFTHPTDRNAVLGAILAELVRTLDTFSQRGFGALRGEWERYHAYQDRRVAVIMPDGARRQGIARGVAEDGALIFETGSARTRLHSGEVSVRAARARGGA